jgi:nicotinamide-nucleotide amidase
MTKRGCNRLLLDGGDGHPRAAIIVIGTELTQGFSRETNSVFLGRWLSERGFKVVSAQKLPDDITLAASAVRRFAGTVDVLIITGGLGSTHDDITRESLAEAMGVPLIRDSQAYEAVAARIPSGADKDSFLRQTYLPEGAKPIMPEAGTAPGVFAIMNQTLIFALPGVPREMETMLDFVAGELRRQGRTNSPPQVARARLAGKTEPEVARLIAPVLEAYPELTVNILAKPEEISLTLISYEERRGDEPSDLERAFADIRSRLGDCVFSGQGESLAAVVGRLLLEKQLTVGTAESVTAGQIGALIATVPGASRYLTGGIISYDNKIKTTLLNVPPAVLESSGAVSPETAAAMAEGVRRVLGCDIGLSVTGIAGPSGATIEKPVGLVYAGLAVEGHIETERAVHRGDREVVQRKTAFQALDLLRRHLLRS